MKTKQRHFEVYRLTISGTRGPEHYVGLLTDARQAISNLDQAVMESGAKSHVLYKVDRANKNVLKLQFMSFTTGFRPDVLDTADFSVRPNPLRKTETNVYWTHMVVGFHASKCTAVVERVRDGISISATEEYLQWLLSLWGSAHPHDPRRDPSEVIVVSLEAEPGEQFMTRLDALVRITKATVRTVRPNPGWKDLNDALSKEADHSDAHRADVTMTARPRASLKTNSGIVAAIRRLFSAKDLAFAAIEGQKVGGPDKFNTRRLGKAFTREFDLESSGQINHEDAFQAIEGELLENGEWRR
jgi:hypothetical protein